ncbi:transposase [Arthrobacter sp. AET 35A]|uniref:transposase n=1 Tax=Arthrobacter sp. AET 35A TaxID=2292643 RepID=UPI001CE274E3|nr:transposase [Arthrobacter sp. AET 35A]
MARGSPHSGHRTTKAKTLTVEYRLVTTLLDPIQAPALGLVRLYHERWEIETAYCELKSRILNGRVLRGRHPAAVIQETWALLSCYQVLRTAMTDVTLRHPEIDPDRLSFTIGLRSARDQVVQARGILSGAVVDLVGRIGAAVLAEPLPARRIRSRPRVVKLAISKYRAKERDVDRRTYPATLNTRILTPDPGP